MLLDVAKGDVKKDELIKFFEKYSVKNAD